MISDEIGALLVEVNRSRTAQAGVHPSQYQTVVAALDDLRQWPAGFIAAAEEHWSLARRADTEGHRRSAAQAYRAAALWFHFATCAPSADAATVRDAETRAAAALRCALVYDDPTAVRIEAGVGEPAFVALVQRPAQVPRPPLVVIIPGLDSSKEEFQLIAAELLARGIATVSIDGPGQGETTAHSTPYPDYERVVAAVLDRLPEAGEFDLDRAGAVGLSLGGYYVARAAAFEPRLRAAVAVTGPYALSDWNRLPPPLQTSLAARAGGIDTAREITARIDLAGVAERISQPLLVVCGDQDPVIDPADPRRLAAEAPRSHLLTVPGGDHLCANTTWRWLPCTGDWLAAQLQATTA